jgi:N-dimethylarginine dimethylaminohydrolase
MLTQNSNTQSMTGDLLRVLVCPPRSAGWNLPEKLAAWRELGFQRPPDFATAQSQHDVLSHILADAGAEVVCLPGSPSLTLDAVYVHDSSLPTDGGVVLMNPGKISRRAEVDAHGHFYSRIGMPILGDIRGHDAGKNASPTQGTSEAGDIVWLDRNTLLVGCGYRTNREGIDQMRALLSAQGIEVISVPLPYASGPSACLHLMSLMSMLDEQTILVDLPWLAVETVELLKARGFRLIEIDYSERSTLACNVLSLGSKRLVAIEENVRTNQRLRDAGFDVRSFPGSEICINGSGGPTCLTRPVVRG